MGAYAAAAGIVLGGIAGGLKDEPEQEVRQFPVFRPETRGELGLRTALQGALRGAGDVTEGGVGLASLLTPSILRELGFEATVDDRRALIPELQAEEEALTAELDELKAQKKQLRRKKSGADGGRQKKLDDRIDRVQARQRRVRTQIKSTQRELSDVTAQPLRVTDLRELAASEIDPVSFLSGANPARQAVNLTLQQAIEALEGKVATDPTLLRAFEERERVLREQLLRQLGPGYETSTPGLQALANFDRERSEAIAAYTRDLAASLTERGLAGETTLQGLVRGGIENKLLLPAFQQESGRNLAEVTQPQLGLLALLQENRKQIPVAALN